MYGQWHWIIINSYNQEIPWWWIAFWVFPRHLSIKSRCFRTLCRFHLQQVVKLKMEPTQCSETSAFNTQTPGKYPENNSSLLQHDESLKSRKKFLEHSTFLLMYLHLVFSCRVFMLTMLVRLPQSTKTICHLLEYSLDTHLQNVAGSWFVTTIWQHSCFMSGSPNPVLSDAYMPPVSAQMIY
jgi:hypothetical protein